jgi:hypothetical protein
MTDVVMMRDVEARYALRERPLRYTVLAPVGLHYGVGALRVLRVREVSNAESGDVADVVLGYDSYE